MHWYVFVENQSYGPYSDGQMRGFVAEGRVTTGSLISNTPQSGFFSATEFDAFNLWSGDAQQSMLVPLIAAGAGSVHPTTSGYAPIQPVQEPQVREQQVRGQQPTQSYQLQPYEQPQALQASQQTAHPTQPNLQPAIQPTVQPQSYAAPVKPEAQVSQVQNNEFCVFLVMAEISSNGEMAFLQALQNFGATQRVGDTVWLVRSSHSVEQIRNTLSQTLNQQDRLFILNSKAGKTAWFNIGTDLDHRIRELWDEDKD